jgi:hypothetical protein
MKDTRERCSICDTGIDESAIEAALRASPIQWQREEVEAYHLRCAVSDGSYLTEAEVTDEDRAHGVYLLEKA